MIADNVTVKGSRLYFAGQDTVGLAERYGTPCYLIDEDKVREKCRIYKKAFEKYFPKGSYPLYASKALSFARMYGIINEEGFGTDVVSSGEIFTAKKAGFPLEKAYFHSNNKTDEDIRFAIKCGVGFFVVDNREELEAINDISDELNVKSRILLRLTPGIDPHTFAAVSTGKVDSKFGSAIETGQAEEIAVYALTLKNIELEGFHCHVGSQVFEADVFIDASAIMLGFIAMMEKRHGYKTKQFDLGGGIGVRYTEKDPECGIDSIIGRIADEMNKKAEEYGISLPEIHMEPGRSIVADAGMTLYSVGTVKRIPGYKNYVSIDGGMTDNPRFALYRSSYTLFAANKMDEECSMCASVVGRCCESGDIIQENVMLPESMKRYDTIAVLTTGAYNYSMASNYNRVARPPVIMLKNGTSYVGVERESLEDIVKNDM